MDFSKAITRNNKAAGYVLAGINFNFINHFLIDAKSEKEIKRKKIKLHRLPVRNFKFLQLRLQDTIGLQEFDIKDYIGQKEKIEIFDKKVKKLLSKIKF